MKIKYWILTLVFIGMAACSGVEIERLSPSKPLPVPQGIKPHVIALSNIKTVIPRGEETIGFGPNQFWDILRCSAPWGSYQTSSIGQYVLQGRIRRQFADTLESLGYDVAGNPGLLFNESEDYMRTRYRIGARIIDSSLSMCLQDDLFMRLDTRTKGEANVEIEWVIYDGLLKKTVYKTKTKGYGDLRQAFSEGGQMLLEEAFAAAVHELGTDQVFHDLIFRSIEPRINEDALGIDREKLPVEDWSENLTIPSNKPFGRDIKSMQKATVLIENGAGGHGSGFFISDDLIMTNAHVVGFADTLRVTLSDKADYTLARLVRTDRPRDIAILRLVERQDKRLYKIAPISNQEIDLGDSVFVVGAPQYKKLQDTVTSGIISGTRYDKKRRQTYIQSDALIHGGNSGGPMFNQNGAVIGISVLGFINSDGGDLAGLNWFIPIHDALEKLNIGQDNIHTQK